MRYDIATHLEPELRTYFITEKPHCLCNNAKGLQQFLLPQISQLHPFLLTVLVE